LRHTDIKERAATLKKFQECLHKEILSTMKAYGQISDRGLKQANYAVLRETRMPAVLTENLFIDRKEDTDKLKDSGFLKAVGEAHARGIAKYLGLSGGSSKQPAATARKRKRRKKKARISRHPKSTCYRPAYTNTKAR